MPAMIPFVNNTVTLTMHSHKLDAISLFHFIFYFFISFYFILFYFIIQVVLQVRKKSQQLYKNKHTQITNGKI